MREIGALATGCHLHLVQFIAAQAGSGRTMDGQYLGINSIINNIQSEPTGERWLCICQH